MLAFGITIALSLVGMIAFCIGGRQEAAYWASHEKEGGCVHYNGKFYRVLSEHDAIDVQLTRSKYLSAIEELTEAKAENARLRWRLLRGLR